AALERIAVTEGQLVDLVETYIMTARNNQPFQWSNERFTCAHRAVLTMASRVADLILWAMNPGVIHIPHIPDTDGEEEWKTAYTRTAQSCGLLNEQMQAGRHWSAFCERYRQQRGKVAWGARAMEELQTALLLEANAAASIVLPRIPGHTSALT